MINTFFFLQAEDGIRDGHVTGVQTCALPILRAFTTTPGKTDSGSRTSASSGSPSSQIGRASCRERVEISVVCLSLQKENERGGSSYVKKGNNLKSKKKDGKWLNYKCRIVKCA